ncbi:RDD family protein [Arenicella xantha]|uniref:RDD family protein n=1 Tax=Arenicella xantha TaxID=644221 RepID=A0A395JMG2_9GAMM|nr:RDD family protein [Arenicella xantha]RBP52834.1 RDD family protein [Arenicella xantha]
MTVSEKTKNYVTPYAFTVSKELLGKRLASPHKRAVAITVDMLLVAVIATFNGLILVALLGSLALIQGFKALIYRNRVGQAIALLSTSACCLMILGVSLYSGNSFKFDSDQVVVPQIAEFDASVPAEVGEESLPNPSEASSVTDQDTDELNKNESEPPSVVAWLHGLVSDLGLSFGWAAFYFTVFVAWMDGQTPGKKLVGTKIIRIDGKPLSLWDSFGRYGGYGAGFATGLLGFLQVYWDQNRQAIQDKIAETMVVDLRKPCIEVGRSNPPLGNDGVNA